MQILEFEKTHVIKVDQSIGVSDGSRNFQSRFEGHETSYRGQKTLHVCVQI